MSGNAGWIWRYMVRLSANNNQGIFRHIANISLLQSGRRGKLKYLDKEEKEKLAENCTYEKSKQRAYRNIFIETKE